MSRNALVTGGTAGIGLATVERFLADPSYTTVVAVGRRARASKALRALAAQHGERLVALEMDVTDETSIATAADTVAARIERLDRLMNCAGLLHDETRGIAPEKRIEQVNAEALHRVFAVNAFGPLLVARALLPLLTHECNAVIANVSARVGSIGDNRLGGWYAYRAAKAAQNMFTQTLAVELARRAPNCACVALHPGTVDTELSRPFSRNAKQVFTTAQAAANLVGLVEKLTSEDSGRFIAWDGSTIPW